MHSYVNSGIILFLRNIIEIFYTYIDDPHSQLIQIYALLSEIIPNVLIECYVDAIVKRWLLIISDKKL